MLVGLLADVPSPLLVCPASPTSLLQQALSLPTLGLFDFLKRRTIVRQSQMTRLETLADA